MERRNNKRGFTLAELLIVVAIIAVLVAIAIPIFTKQLEKSREATDISNVRSAYAEVMTQYMTDGGEQSMVVTARQKQEGWQGSTGTIVTQIDGQESEQKFSAHTDGDSYTVKIADSGSTTLVEVK